jgi:hypothetical protein
MQNTNYVVATPNSIIGYIDESTPCGRAKAKQVKADLEQLAIMQNDSNLTASTKKAIVTDYMQSIRDYVMKEETCCCHSECECDCEEEEEEYEEEYEVATIEDMDNFVISTNSTFIECDCYEDTINKIMLLEALGWGYDVYAYDNEDNEYPCRVVDNGNDLSLEFDN